MTIDYMFTCFEIGGRKALKEAIESVISVTEIDSKNEGKVVVYFVFGSNFASSWFIFRAVSLWIVLRLLLASLFILTFILLIDK